MSSVLDRFKKAWNVFTSRSPTESQSHYGSGGFSYRPDRLRLRYSNEKTTIAAIYNQISIDCSEIDVKHVQTDVNGRFTSTMDSSLEHCLSLDANVDQTGRALVQDAVLTLLDEGCVAIVITEADINPSRSDSAQIRSLRVGRVTQWFPESVEVELYNESSGKREKVTVPKSMTAIVQNPFYGVMNEPNGTLRRLTRKLALLDDIDENDYRKLDMIIQVPYATKTDSRRALAEKRRKDVETQLNGSRYGIAYIDGTEHVTQLNRSLDNHLLDQITQLKEELYAQLGLTKEIFNGTANEQTTLNYYNRTIEPIMTTLTEEMTRKFLSKNARTRGQKITYIRDPFKLVPVNSIADIADKFTRNAILSSNEIRGLIGFKPVDDPDADSLRNKNLNLSDQEQQQMNGAGGPPSAGSGGAPFDAESFVSSMASMPIVPRVQNESNGG